MGLATRMSGTREGAGVPTARPPVALGCTAAVAVVAILVVVVVAGVGFLESGTEGGLVPLRQAASYGRGTVTFAGEHNLYVVRLENGDFLALADLDAANRANPGRRCRVAPIPTDDPALRGLLAQYGPRMSPGAAGSTLLFRETCNSALYDFTGVRLDQDGRNLDRYQTDIRDGKLAVNLGTRTCSTREGQALATPVPCD